MKAVMGDTGRYECHLSNEMGSITGVCNVQVHKIFKPPFFSRQMNNVKQLVNCDARCQFHQRFTHSFCSCRSKMCPKDSPVISVFLRFWDLSTQKLLIECWWNWPQESISSTFFVQKFFVQYFSNFSLLWIFLGGRITAQQLLIKCWWNWLSQI